MPCYFHEILYFLAYDTHNTTIESEVVMQVMADVIRADLVQFGTAIHRFNIPLIEDDINHSSGNIQIND
ncbi:hypothetical protein JCM12294_26940 [Desulfocicer niacini]